MLSSSVFERILCNQRQQSGLFSWTS